MKRSARNIAVTKAEVEIIESINALWQKHGLTPIEMLQILNGRESMILKYMLREERNPDDPDKPADIE